MSFWFIIIIFLLVLGVRSVARSSRLKAQRSSQPMPTLPLPVRTNWAGIPGSTNRPPAAPGNAPVYPVGNSPTYRPGDSATYRPGDAPTYRPGDSATYRPGDAPTYQLGNSPTYAPGDAATYQPGNSPTYRPGNAPTYPPGQYPVYLDGGPTGLPPEARPVQPPTQPGSKPDSFQPAYATRIEQRNARRNQATIDRDRRAAARTDSTQEPYQVSTAISSSSLNTTLAMPYQPSSLTSSLSSSLSTSLSDSPPQIWGSAVLAGIQAVELPSAVEEQVILMLNNGTEVAAVQIIVDQMNVGILEATKTIRQYDDR